MSRVLLDKITLALAVVGCIIALVLTYEHFFPKLDIGCGLVGGNCNTTIESKYGKLGPIPTSLLGLGMYLTVAGLCVLRGRSLAGKNGPESDAKLLGTALFGISLLAFCISWWLQYASLFLIFSFCPWCFGSALTVTAIFLVNGYDFLIVGRALTGEQKMLSGVLIFIGAMLAFLYAPAVIVQYRSITGKKVAAFALPNEGPNPVGMHPREEILSSNLVFKGKPTALYTIVEFADYGCSHCKEAAAALDKLVAKSPDRYRIAFRNFPLGRWPASISEAEAATAAAKQGKFWEMHDVMFAHQSEVESPSFDKSQILDWAKSIGLNTDKLQTDMTSQTVRDQVRHDHDIGWLNNVSLTPTFFVVPADPKAQVRMVIGDDDAKIVLFDPKSPFWSGDLSVLKYQEKPNSPGPPVPPTGPMP